ncbi:MAG TPA: methylmalonyl-CoA mutase family protein, partial [Trichormus sp.]
MTEKNKNVNEPVAAGNKPAKAAASQSTCGSGQAVKYLWRPQDLDGWDAAKQLGAPGQYPYTRGVHADMYRSRLW